MKDLIQEFHKRLLIEISRLQLWSEEESIIDRLKNDLSHTNESDIIPCINKTLRECFEQYHCIGSKPKEFDYSIVYMLQDIHFNPNSFGGISRELDKKVIYINLFKVYKFQNDNFELMSLKSQLLNLFSHPVINSTLHHEIAHYHYSKRFRTYNDYLKHVEVDDMKKDASEEEYNSYLQEFQALIKNVQKIDPVIVIPDTYDEVMSWFDLPFNSNPYIQNLKLHLQLFPKERVDKDLRKILRKAKFGESYGNLFSDIFFTPAGNKTSENDIIVDFSKPPKPLPSNHPLRQINFHTIGDEEMREILEQAKQIDKLGWLKDKK